MGKESEARALAETSVSAQHFPSSPDLWALRLHIHTKLYSLSQPLTLADEREKEGKHSAKSEKKGKKRTESESKKKSTHVTFGSLVRMYEDALKSVALHNSLPLWKVRARLLLAKLSCCTLIV